ncbi:MAG: hypothetical protein Q4D62_13995 [Planctomycetia bacterium]|nr:hypothetical protein [Planctomycetia bacterium]
MKKYIAISMKPGSTRCKRKNFREIADGVRIWELTFQKAKRLLEDRLVDCVRVYSSDDDVAQLVENWGFEFSKISVEAERGLESVSLKMALEEIQDDDWVLKISVVNPFVKLKTLKKCLAALENVPAAECAYSMQAILVDKNGLGITWKNDESRPPTQTLEPVYDLLGTFSVHGFLIKSQRVLTVSRKLIPVTKLESIDIDTEEDFMFAKALYPNYQEEMECPELS